MLSLSIPFVRTSFLYLLVLLPLLGAMSLIAARRRKAALGRMGRPETVAGLSSLRPGGRRRSRVLVFLGLASLILAVAGPRWGKGGDAGVVVGRDLVVVLDLSRSMTAADMADPVNRTRWEAARAGLRDLVAEVEKRGGHRLALVVFAARPWVVCPLTSDYDHFRARLDEFSPTAPPPEVRPDPDEPLVTGTAIGAALRMALTAHDPRFPGYQDILLLSDGDGPGVEVETEGGVKDAADRLVPVYVVGVGDPFRATELVFGEGESAEFVGTKLQEGLLREIARRTRGEYLPARRDVPPLGDWFARTIEPRPSRELADDAMPQPKDRSIWFAGVGLIFLLLGWILEP
ncbi:MAG TPA: VWA domain-containing protein [Gemmataceae bacterium]|jgi:Ca-activated chloride channel family protein|nr:VWA domain-containing protein [Gemmataceae bacterium]